jgi:hypothetical protein
MWPADHYTYLHFAMSDSWGVSTQKFHCAFLVNECEKYVSHFVCNAAAVNVSVTDDRSVLPLGIVKFMKQLTSPRALCIKQV